jgi:hypothetical protein
MNTPEFKTTLLPVAEKDVHILKDIFRSLLQLKGVYIAQRDIEIESFDDWSFYKVSIFRWSDAGAGCGSVTTRDRTWEQQQAAVDAMFDQWMPPESTWRHIHTYGHLYDMSKPFDGKDRDTGHCTIPGVKFFIKKGQMTVG